MSRSSYTPPTVTAVGSLADLTLAWSPGTQHSDDSSYTVCFVAGNGENHPVMLTGGNEANPNSLKDANGDKPCPSVLVGSL